jgi:hypothetical protein
MYFVNPAVWEKFGNQLLQKNKNSLCAGLHFSSQLGAGQVTEVHSKLCPTSELRLAQETQKWIGASERQKHDPLQNLRA